MSTCSCRGRSKSWLKNKKDTLYLNEGDYVVDVVGGEHHTICRTHQGLVFAWGTNDEGQLGLGDTYGEFDKQQRLLREKST